MELGDLETIEEKVNKLINTTKLKIITMYNLEQFHFVEVKEQKKDEIICIIEHEDSKELLEFVVDHENIEQYHGDCGFYDYIVDPSGDYEDVCSNLFIDLKTSENSESINGLHVRSVPTKKAPFSEHEILSL